MLNVVDSLHFTPAPSTLSIQVYFPFFSQPEQFPSKYIPTTSQACPALTWFLNLHGSTTKFKTMVLSQNHFNYLGAFFILSSPVTF